MRRGTSSSHCATLMDSGIPLVSVLTRSQSTQGSRTPPARFLATTRHPKGPVMKNRFPCDCTGTMRSRPRMDSTVAACPSRTRDPGMVRSLSFSLLILAPSPTA